MHGKVVVGDDEITRERTLRQPDPVDELFTSEEMQAIREQYEERLQASEERREELEWQVRLTLARIRDAEQGARRSADEMARVYASLAQLLGDSEPQAAASQTPRPPPIPSAPSGPRRSAGPLRPGYKRMVA
jgi:outer membrane protein TolC